MQGEFIELKQVELLAPAGNYEALDGCNLCRSRCCISWRATAFGARAYADNFSQKKNCAKESVMAHILWQTDLSYSEYSGEGMQNFRQLVTFLIALVRSRTGWCHCTGSWCLCRLSGDYFPHLPVHVKHPDDDYRSGGCTLLKGTREFAESFLARELSLKEIRRIREETGIEIETFIHGAMCYCYSGQCLFSSILGGRSGNRGRCAQPCRLPYTMKNQKECYPLSMKDMCTIEILPELIEAGIDSFKIEGRMKKPAYAAGVTSIYRKYIDLYYSGKPYEVAEADREFLSSLYIRSEVGEGYYHQKNGRNMITLSSPAYSKTSEQVLETIENQYLKQNRKIEIDATISLKKGEPGVLFLTDGNVQASAIRLYTTGGVETALKRRGCPKTDE